MTVLPHEPLHANEGSVLQILIELYHRGREIPDDTLLVVVELLLLNIASPQVHCKSRTPVFYIGDEIVVAEFRPGPIFLCLGANCFALRPGHVRPHREQVHHLDNFGLDLSDYVSGYIGHGYITSLRVF